VFAEPGLLEQVTWMMRSALPEDFDVESEGIERHGSWEWAAHRKPGPGDIDQFVVLACTPLSPQPVDRIGTPTRVLADVWVAADAGQRYARRGIAHREVVGSARDIFHGLEAEMPRVLAEAARVASGMSPDALDDAYPDFPPASRQVIEPRLPGLVRVFRWLLRRSRPRSADAPRRPPYEG